MPIKGFTGSNTFMNSKIASRKVLSDSKGKGMVPLGKNTSKSGVGLKSKSAGVKMNGK